MFPENNYYPFGMRHKGYNNVINGTDHPYGFLNQEENDELGLNWLTFRYRNYMPDVGRFFGVDPISEDFLSISNYQFAHNSPIWKIEIEGLEGEVSPEIPGAIDIPNHEPVRGNTHVGSSAIPIGDGTGNHGSASKKPLVLPTGKIDYDATMNGVMVLAARVALSDGPGAGPGDVTATGIVISAGTGIALAEIGMEAWNLFANTYNALNAEEASTAQEAAEETSTAGEATEATETSRTAKERAETANEVEAALNQTEGIEKAQEQAKKEVKGEKQNKIRSVKKSQQRLKNALKRIDPKNLDDF